MRTLQLAHRGLRRDARENTIEAFEAAHQAGFDGVEFDVRALGDGTVVLHHDARTVGGQSLRRLDAATWRGDTWADLARWARRRPRMYLDVDVKQPGLAARLERTLRRRASSSFVVTFFDLAEARKVAAEQPGWHVGWIAPRRSLRPVARVRRAGLGRLVLHHRLATPQRIQRARRLGLAVYVWGVPPASGLIPGVEAIIVDWSAPVNRPRAGTSRDR